MSEATRNVQKRGGLPKPIEGVIPIEGEFGIDPTRKSASIGSVREFGVSLLDAMKRQNFGEAELFAVRLILEELVQNAVNHCMKCKLHTKAQISEAQTKVELKWKQKTGARLEDLAEQRTSEIEGMKAKAYDRSLSKRLEQKKTQGFEGGAGLGLVLVGAYADEFTTTYDEKTRTMTATFVKKKK